MHEPNRPNGDAGASAASAPPMPADPVVAQSLTHDDLMQGATYRGKSPRRVARTGEYNDRTIIWGPSVFGELQYDGPAVADGRHYPRTTVAKFLAWAGKRIS